MLQVEVCDKIEVFTGIIQSGSRSWIMNHYNIRHFKAMVQTTPFKSVADIKLQVHIMLQAWVWQSSFIDVRVYGSLYHVYRNLVLLIKYLVLHTWRHSSDTSILHHSWPQVVGDEFLDLTMSKFIIWLYKYMVVKELCLYDKLQYMLS